jgi:hypothetical protein
VGIRNTKREDGNRTNTSIPRLGKYIPCACRFISHRTWSYPIIANNRRIRPSYSICWQKTVRIRAELQYHREKRIRYRICTSKVQTLLIGKTFQDVYRPFSSQIPHQQANVGGGRIYIWLLLFQELDFELIVKRGKLNVGPDHLSTITNGEEPMNIEEKFPDA